MGVTQLALTWVQSSGQTVKKLCGLACKFDLDKSERKSLQVKASARKAWSNREASRPMFSACVYLRLRLARAGLFESRLTLTRG